MRSPLIRPAAALAILVMTAWATAAGAAATEPADPAPTAEDWAQIARLPDWSGVWTPDVIDQNKQASSNPPPWTAPAARKIAALVAQEAAGHPKGLFVDCLPEGLPALMLITHNPVEFVFTPGRVLLLGESDGDRQRRIYTDGRGHPADPDPTFFGHSIGHWEGDTLVVDTIGVLPETYIALGEAVGLPNDGDLHVTERIRLTAPDTLADDLTIDAPKVLTAPWRTTRLFYRHRERSAEISEGVCLQGRFAESVDDQGDAVFTPLQFDAEGAPLPPKP
ncbi:MAG: hypothetical protein JO303_09415 [Caulobacteraceae bacterium]|nr:hypothetical protein [Caulobacteraceae bacterium]